MPGLFVALLIVGISVAGGGALEPAYLLATNVLFWWYVAWTVPIGLVAVLTALGFSLGGALAGLGAGGGRLALAGLGGGSIMGFGLAALMLVRRGLFITGALLLSSARCSSGCRCSSGSSRDVRPCRASPAQPGARLSSRRAARTSIRAFLHQKTAPMSDSLVGPAVTGKNP